MEFALNPAVPVITSISSNTILVGVILFLEGIQMLSDYQQDKRRISIIVDELLDVLPGLEIDGSSITILQDRKEKLELDNFNLVVLGQYKRGKTTFINALLGAEILPTAVVPLTSIVTRISYGEEPQAQVKFSDGTTIKIMIDDLKKYVTETENPCNVKAVSIVEVNYPSVYLSNGVSLIDTPGIGSVFTHNTDATYDFIPMVDAAIFILSADPPISREEYQFLTEITRYVRKIFFVQNKIDVVNEIDREQSLAFSKRIIEQETQLRDISIYPISAKQALDGTINANPKLHAASRMAEFKMNLEKFLVEGRQKTLLSAVAHIATQYLNKAEMKLELERAALELPISEVEAKLTKLKDHFKELRQDRMDLEYLLKGELDRFSAQLEQELATFKVEAVKDLSVQAHDFLLTRELINVKNLASELQGFLQKVVIEKLSILQSGKEQETKEWLNATTGRFEEKSDVLISDIRNLAANLFSVKTQVIRSETRLSSKSNLYFLTEIPKTSLFFNVSWFMGLLPKQLAYKTLYKSSVDQIEELVEMNCSRLRFDLYSRIAQSFKTFKYQLNINLEAVMNDIVKTIGTAITQKRQGETIAHKRRLELDQSCIRLSTLSDDLLPFVE